MNMKLLFLSCLLLLSVSVNNANQVDNLNKLIKPQRYQKPLQSQSQIVLEQVGDNPFSPGHQDGSKEDDKIDALPGQPTEGVDFDQYAGYVTVDADAGRALFYYFVESPQNSSTAPLVLWLNGGPGCSSLGFGAMEELGPFRVNSNGNSLYMNDYAWNNEANVLFLESPAGVGFSYSNTTSDYQNVGDNKTASDSYKFLINWLEKFPEYKTRDFYITGESYAGHYVPQLAYTIVSENKITNQTKINLKGIAIGNAWIDASTGAQGQYDYLWSHALNSDETMAGINKYCDFVALNITSSCEKYMSQSDNEVGNIDSYNIYAPLCGTESPAPSASSVYEFDPCSDDYVNTYLNLPEVQAALHARPTRWSACGHVGWTDSPDTVLPIIQELIASGIRLWVYSGDVDSVVAVTTTRLAINTMNLKTTTPFRPWYSSPGEVGGYVIMYEGLVFATVRGAGHEVPSYQPGRALTLFSAFLQGAPLPSS
ncbi:hypothetical protein ACLB2K_058774 [Fragaria x ananassa]